MARYEHLPIYKQAMDVAVHFEKVVAGFCELALRGIPAYPASALSQGFPRHGNCAMPASVARMQ